LKKKRVGTLGGHRHKSSLASQVQDLGGHRQTETSQDNSGCTDATISNANRGLSLEKSVPALEKTFAGCSLGCGLVRKPKLLNCYFSRAEENDWSLVFSGLYHRKTMVQTGSYICRVATASATCIGRHDFRESGNLRWKPGRRCREFSPEWRPAPLLPTIMQISPDRRACSFFCRSGRRSASGPVREEQRLG
jgi:hypothetical protein